MAPPGRPRRTLKWVLGSVLALAAVVFLIDGLQTIKWVGSTDLTVVFVVTDAGTGAAVPGATVEVENGGGFYRGGHAEDVAGGLMDYELTTGADGAASVVCLGSMCFGTKSLLTDTFVVHLPSWRVRTSAPGYRPAGWVEVDVLEYQKAVERVEPGQARVVIPIKLNRE